MTSRRLAEKVAVVTGGASGIGEASARRFVAEGASVVIADVQQDAGSSLARELGSNAEFVRTDVTDEDALAEAVNRAVQHFGRIDVMFNNAGIIGATGPVSMTDRDNFRATMAVLFESVVFGTKHAAAAMLATGTHGSIISTSSVAAVSGGLGAHTYSAAKAAVIGFTQSVAAELWPHGIRVNALLPGRILTPMTAALRSDASGTSVVEESPEAMRADRRTTAEDIANSVLFLASDESAFITGESLLVDGGLVRAGGPSPMAIGKYATPAMFERSGGL